MSSSEDEQYNEIDSDDDRRNNEELFRAIRKNKLTQFLKLLESVKDINIIDKNNKSHTLLHYAVDRNREGIVQELLRPERNIDINATNENGNTPLHIAYSKGRAKLIKLLRNAKAETGIKNSNGKTATELGKRQKHIIPSAHSEAGPSGLQQLQRKRKSSEFDDAQLKKSRDSQGTKRTNDEDRKHDNDSTKKLKSSKKCPASALKSTLHGVAYQIKLSMLFLIRAVTRGSPFRLTMEMKTAEKFDDIVFQYQGGEWMFVQVKHTRIESSKISLRDLLPRNKNHKKKLNLQRYLISYCKMKDKREFTDENNKIRDLVIFTNMDFKYGDERKGLTLSDGIFEGAKDESILKADLLRFKKDFAGKGKIVSVLRDVYDSNNLATANTDKDTVIQDFLDKLVFAVNQPDEIRLGEIVEDEMGELGIDNPNDRQLMANGLHNEMNNWLKEKKERYLELSDGEAIIARLKMELARTKLNPLTRKYRRQMEEMNIRFANDEKKLQEFLKPENGGKQLFILTSTPDTILGSIKVHQTLENMTRYKKEDNYSFMQLEYFLNMQNVVADVFGSHEEYLLIIECGSVEDSERESYGEDMLFEAIKSNRTRKVILITDQDNELTDKYERTFDGRYLKGEVEVNSLDDLDNESQTKMKERRLKFQGQEVSLCDLTNEEPMNFIDAEALSKLVKNEALEIAKPLKAREHYYIPRTLNRWEKIDRSFKDNTSKFFVHSEYHDSRPLPDQDVVLISDDREHFKKLNDENYKKHNTHRLKPGNDEYTWQESNGVKGALSKLRNYVDKRPESVTTYAPEKVAGITDEMVIVTAEPGMGKSTAMTSLALEMKESDPSLWVAMINLSTDCTKELNELESKKIQINEKEIIKFLIDVGKLTPGLEQEFFKDCYRRRKMALLLDGFDEISPGYTDKVIELLKFLKGTKVGKIWVTTRPYNIKNHLEDELGLFSYVLKEFCEDDQRSFLKKFWTTRLKLDHFDDERAKVFIDVLLHNFSKSINDPDRKFISVPLQLKMVADIFKDTFAEFHGSADVKLSNDQKQKMEKKLDLIHLYDEFFKKKFDDIFYDEKISGRESTLLYNIIIKKETRNNVIKRLKHSALLNLYGNKRVKELLPEIEIEKLLKDVKQSEEKSGIIDRVVDGKPIFVHQSFAEYFAALWFSEKLRDENQEKEQKVKEFLREHIFEDESRVIRHFLDRKLTEDKSNDKRSEIHIAVLNNNEGEVDILLTRGAGVLDTRDKAGRTPLHLAAAYGHIKVAESLLRVAQEHENLNIWQIKDKLFAWSPLSYAARNNHWDVVELLLKKGADGGDIFEALKGLIVDIGGENEWKANMLHSAAFQGHLEIIKYLVDEKKANCEAIDLMGQTPLQIPAMMGHLDIIKYLVDKGNANFEAIDAKGRTLLHIAVEEGHLDIIEYLVDERQANCEAIDLMGQTPLHIAAMMGRLDIIKYLDEKKANFEATNAGGESPLHIAAMMGHLDIIKYLDKKIANCEAIDLNRRTRLHIAAKASHLDIIKYLVDEKKANCEATDLMGRTPLHIAAMIGHLDIIKYLVDEKKANCEAIDLMGRTPLHIAAMMGHLDIIKYLDEKKANFEAIDAKGRTLLHIAVEEAHLDIIEYLVDERQANCEAIDLMGRTPLHIAAIMGRLVIIKYLDEKKANFEATNAGGESPLHIAAMMGHLDIIKYLVDEKKANYEATDLMGRTPLHIAAMMGHLDIIKYLDEKKANFEAIDAEEETGM